MRTVAGAGVPWPTEGINSGFRLTESLISGSRGAVNRRVPTCKLIPLLACSAQSTGFVFDGRAHLRSARHWLESAAMSHVTAPSLQRNDQSATYPGRILRKTEVFGQKSRTGLPETSGRRLMAAGKFPKPIQLAPRSVGWLESEVDAWIAARVAERDGEAAS